MKGEWSCYRGSQFNEERRSFYGGGQFNGGRNVTEVVSLIGKNGHVTGVASLMEGAWSCYRGVHFNGRRTVMLQKRSLYWWENGHTEVVSFMEGVVILQRCSL